MKIKLAILENDQNYLDRIVNVFETKYADKFQIYSFTDPAVAFSTLEQVRIDVLIANDSFEIATDALPKRCGFAYLVEAADIHTFKGQRVICKFQKVDLIYKQILGIYSEYKGNEAGFKADHEGGKIIFFEPVSGGAGASTMAAACAIRFASRGKRTLYLNLERFGSSFVFFDGVGQFDMSDVIFALKSKKANLPMKLESCVRCSENGVNFYADSKVALDMMEINSEEVLQLLSAIQVGGAYDYIIVDVDFRMDAPALKILRAGQTTVWVGDGSAPSNAKLFRAAKALSILEQKAESSLLERTVLIYNKFSNKTSKAVSDIEIKNIGGAPRYEHATTKQILEQLSKMEFFDKLM